MVLVSGFTGISARRLWQFI